MSIGLYHNLWKITHKIINSDCLQGRELSVNGEEAYHFIHLEFYIIYIICLIINLLINYKIDIRKAK